jgi:hypothetical protein
VKHSVGTLMLGGALMSAMAVVNGPVALAKSKCVPLNGTNLVQSRTHNPGIGMKVLTTESYSYREGQVVWQFESTGGLKVRSDAALGGEYVAPYSAAGAQPAAPGATITIVAPGYISTITVCKQ